MSLKLEHQKKGKQGRSKCDGKCGRGYAKVKEDYSAKSLTPIFTDHISANANVVADCWSGYKPLKEDYPNLTQILSEKGKNFPMIHHQIRNFKNWLRGVHSYCDKEYLQKYNDEYFFRFNRRNHRESIWEKLIDKMMAHKPMQLSEIKLSAI